MHGNHPQRARRRQHRPDRFITHQAITRDTRPRVGSASRQTSRCTHPTHRPHPPPGPSHAPKSKPQPRRRRTRQIVPTPLNTRRADAGAPCTHRAHDKPGQTRAHAAGQTRTQHRNLTATAPGTSPSRAPRDAPEPDSP